ncbi:MAG: hypothetical protein GWO00_03995, partial [Gemmatimonadetes bacterium]|nr:hypothetical protein [Gemmatimonadota bacterium]NIR77567.1 hypothetical protein [Gemmatimonadota bacterium]NIT86114.1 hypothetical protein [Gemmatimonadota bacterium]NIU29931.1 hypothetical protein [Gemmatimonadota bacterium]NIV60340.1 hypothetical protein [Gemmatimonadota bacterium]
LPVDFRRTDDPAEAVVSRSLLELLPSDAVIVRLGPWSLQEHGVRTWRRVSTLYDSLVDSGATPGPPDTLFLPPEDLERRIST